MLEKLVSFSQKKRMVSGTWRKGKTLFVDLLYLWFLTQQIALTLRHLLKRRLDLNSRYFETWGAGDIFLHLKNIFTALIITSAECLGTFAFFWRQGSKIVTLYLRGGFPLSESVCTVHNTLFQLRQSGKSLEKQHWSVLLQVWCQILDTWIHI